MTAYEKFGQGGWVTLALTAALVALCVWIRRHYRRVQESVRSLDEVLAGVHDTAAGVAPSVDPAAPTAVLLVGGYGGIGVHSLLSIHRLFPSQFHNFVFLSVGVIDSATFQNLEAVDEVQDRVASAVRQYVDLARGLGFAAEGRSEVGTEVVDTVIGLCTRLASEYPRAMFFAGNLVFEQEGWWHRFLHNETAYAIQRELAWRGHSLIILPIRVTMSSRVALPGGRSLTPRQ